MNNAARYTISHCSMGWALVAEHNDGTGEGTLLGYFDTRTEAAAVKRDLLSLRKGVR